MTAPRTLQRLRSEARGQVPIEFALGVGLLVLPIALMVLAFPTWSERQSMGRLAAQEAARTIVLADSVERGFLTAQAVVAEIAANHGLHGSAALAAVNGSLGRGGVVTTTVRVVFPLTEFPGLVSVGSFTWDVSHSEQVDRYRSFSRP